MAKKSSSQKRPEMSEAEIKARTEAHPAAVPFLWLAHPAVVKNFIYVPIIGLVIFSILGFFFPLHHPAPWDIVPFSYAIVGFVSYCFVVFAAGPLFKLLSRDENYYGEVDDD